MNTNEEHLGVKSAAEQLEHDCWLGLVSATDQDLAENFLGDDFTAICGAAERAKDMVFIVAAGMPKAKRKEVYQQWRHRIALQVVKSYQGGPELLDELATEQADQIKTGQLPPRAVDEIVSDKLAEKRQAATKKRLVELHRLNMAVLDWMPGFEGNEAHEGLRPSVGTLLETGEIKFFKSEDAANSWSRPHGVRYFLFSVSGFTKKVGDRDE